MLLLTTLACLPNLTEHDRPEEGALAIDAVAPEYAHTGGGTELELFGGPFDGTVKVEVDGVQAKVLVVEPDRLVIESPALEATGYADIRVSSDVGDGGMEDAVRVFEDGRGLAGSFGALEWYELQGDYWTSDSDDWGVAWWGLIEPEEVHYWDIFDTGGMDKCVSSPSFPALNVMDLGVEQTELVAENSSLALPASEDRYFDGPLYDFPQRSVWSLPQVQGGELPDFSIDELAVTPEAFDLYQPYLFGDAPPTLTKSDFRLEWGDVEADRVMVMLKRYDASLEEEIEVLGCVAENDGEFHVKGVNWTQPWEADQWVYIYVGAVLEGEGVVPLNGADSRVAGVYWLVGAAVTAK
jgi:hypothetical protein